MPSGADPAAFDQAMQALHGVTILSGLPPTVSHIRDLLGTDDRGGQLAHLYLQRSLQSLPAPERTPRG
jgi:hypothetical protein